jgi:hypothetical protein
LIEYLSPPAADFAGKKGAASIFHKTGYLWPSAIATNTDFATVTFPWGIVPG